MVNYLFFPDKLFKTVHVNKIKIQEAKLGIRISSLGAPNNSTHYLDLRDYSTRYTRGCDLFYQ